MGLLRDSHAQFSRRTRAISDGWRGEGLRCSLDPTLLAVWSDRREPRARIPDWCMAAALLYRWPMKNGSRPQDLDRLPMSIGWTRGKIRAFWAGWSL